MGRTPLFRRMLETIRRAKTPDHAAPQPSVGVSRRDVLRLGGAAAATIATPRLLTACAPPEESGETLGTNRAGLVTANIGIVGAGIAGLACATELGRYGVAATLHEAGTRSGGRIYSSMNDAAWGGQAFEKGGEFIDTGHKTMIAYARELGLALEEVSKPARDNFYYFAGRRVAESVMVEEYRVLVDAMRDDLRDLGSPTADSYLPADRALDVISLAEYLDRRGALPNIKELLNVAYTIEYGVDSSALSSLAFLFFAKASRQAKLRLFGNFSDERYHVVGGNQQVTDGLAARLGDVIRYGRKLLAVKKLSDGRIQLTMSEGRKTITATHDGVVLTLPFHLLRQVELDASLGLPDWKKNAINQAVQGNNTKLMVGFAGRPWVDAGGNGTAYSDLPYLQVAWESSPGSATATRAILTNFTGGTRATLVSPTAVQTEAERFLNAYDQVLPGSKARARRDARGRYLAHLEHWPSNPLAQGGYTANAPGYFTTIAGNEGKPVGNLFFGGETTDSFYSWQGFMEGAALSGHRTASEIVGAFG